MITKFRDSANSRFVRILLALIALSFVGFGGAQFIGGNSQGDVVSFSGIDSISFEEFNTARIREIDTIQKQNGINLSDEDIAELDINNVVLRNLIKNSMLKYLSKIYELDISDDKVISYIKESPFFKNNKGQFDINIFKTSFNNSPMKEEGYLNSIKNNLIYSTLLETLRNSFIVPDPMTENIINYMSETRFVDVYSYDLNYKPTNYFEKEISTDDLEKYYKDNKDTFVIEEQRSFDYIKVDKNYLQKGIKISESDVKNYYENYKGEFEAKKYNEVKKEIKDQLISEKLIDLANDLAKKLEEDVSAGMSLTEIANKNNFTINHADNVNFTDINSGKVPGLDDIADMVFELADKEVSYPIELHEKSEIYLVSIKSITPSKNLEFSEVKEQIKSTIQKQNLILSNTQRINNIRDNILTNTGNIDGLSVKPDMAFVRANFDQEKRIPLELIGAVVSAEKNSPSKVIIVDNIAHFIVIKKINFDKQIAAKVKKEQSDNFSNVIKDGMFQELIIHLTKQNKMKVNNIFLQSQATPN